MKFEINRKIIAIILVFAFAAFGSACQNQQPSNSATAAKPASSGEGGTTPTDAYIKLYTAVKSKQPDAIKAVMSEKTIGFAQFAGQRQNQTFEKVIENGFTMTTFSETLPEMRDERIKDDSGSVEVWNAKDARWEDLPFIKENGSWKFAMGDLFAGTFKSPGKGRAQLESEAANVNGSGLVPITPNAANGNANPPKVIKPMLEEKKKLEKK